MHTIIIFTYAFHLFFSHLCMLHYQAYMKLIYILNLNKANSSIMRTENSLSILIIYILKGKKWVY